MKDCIFCQIRDKKLPAKFVYESENIMAFADINPVAELHVLIVPKEHVQAIKNVKDQGKLLQEVYGVVDKLVEENNLSERDYRVLVNGGTAQKVPHLHFHLLGGNWKKDFKNI